VNDRIDYEKAESDRRMCSVGPLFYTVIIPNEKARQCYPFIKLRRRSIDFGKVELK